MTAKRYRSRPVETFDVAAAKWDGSNADELTELLGACFQADEHGARVLTDGGIWTPLHVGDFAYIAPGAVIGVWDGAKFTALFEAVGADA